jgi:hypothetical protein
MPILFLFQENRESTHGDAPVSMLRYSTVCFLVMTLVVLVALYVKSRWGLLAPLIVGYGGAVLSIAFSALLFARYHARQLLPIERKRLTIGCFFVLWFYNDFLAIVSHSITHAEWTGAQVLDAIFDTALDFAYVWAIVRYVVVWILRLAAPPNQRLERPVRLPLDAP